MIKVHIDNILFTVHTVPLNGIELGEGKYLGREDYDRHKIYIADTLQGTHLKEVLIHEVTHAYLDRFRHTKENYTLEELCEMSAIFAERIVNTTTIILKELNSL